jgi:hypothetical protein
MNVEASIFLPCFPWQPAGATIIRLGLTLPARIPFHGEKNYEAFIGLYGAFVRSRYPIRPDSPSGWAA